MKTSAPNFELAVYAERFRADLPIVRNDSYLLNIVGACLPFYEGPRDQWYKVHEGGNRIALE
ncbi:hypothetical protein D3C83_256680 [compost metagenome]